jgi:hypothetical protein
VERAGQTEVSKHPCRDVWPVGWSHLEPQTSWPRPLTAPGQGPVSPRLLPRTRQPLPLSWPPPWPSPPQPTSSRPPPQPSCPWPPCQLRPPHHAPPAQCQRVAVAASAEGRGVGTTGGAPSTTHRGATTATYRTAACRDASVAVTTNGATQTADPGDDHAAGLVAPLHWSNVDIV